MISFAEVKRMSRLGNVIPIIRRIPSDLETPVSAYMKVAGRTPYSFLLESIQGGEKLARYSFIGFDPFLIVKGSADQVTVVKGKDSRTIAAKPTEFMEALFAEYTPVSIEGLPRFTGGAVGYFAYDSAGWFERLPNRHPNPTELPQMMFGLYRSVIAFDHLKQEIVIIANLFHTGSSRQLKMAYDDAVVTLDQITRRLKAPLKGNRSTGPASSKIIRPQSDQASFESAVRKAKKYIKEGDIFQVVLSRRWAVDSSRSELDVYRRLRRINPSPYMFLLRFGDNAVVGASPEMMVRVEGRSIETRPIAGTRPRGKSEAEDARRIASLLADPKELAEHTMLVDLGRNDLGRVCKTGTVRVAEKMIIEKYSHVIHIVSSVVGELKPGSSPIQAHFACFPAGTVSGAPKIRAMQIIDELESQGRGIYAGSIAYIDFWGNLDSCIAIRTLVKTGKRYHVQAGAGIVADSIPRREFRETEAKASVLIQAVVGD
ncbi:MAG: anthranilate synthase component I [Candidatus Zixiibacteriota bacterium]